MQIFGIHVLRGLAAFAVVVHHASYELTGLGIPTWLPDAEAGAFGVDIFFVISGFVMVYASRGLFGRASNGWGFLWRRIARVAPLYWLVTTAVLAILALSWRKEGVPESAVGWIAGSYLFWPVVGPSGLGLPVLGVGWTLLYEMFFYVVFAATLAFSMRHAALVLTAIFLALAVVFYQAELPYAARFLFNPIILEFVAGMWLALAYLKGVRVPRTIGFAAAAGAALVALGLGHQVYGPWGAWRPFIWGPLALLIVGGLTLARPAPDLSPGPLRRFADLMGDSSYALYLTHMPTFWVLQIVSRDNALPALRDGFVYTALLLVAPLLVGIAAHYLAERPLLDLARGRRPRWPLSGSATDGRRTLPSGWRRASP